MSDDQPDQPDQPDQSKRPAIPPLLVNRPYTKAEAARMQRLAEAGKRAEEAASKLPHEPATEPLEQPERPVIDLDADPHNANWLRILAQRRKDKADG
jgi:hypothetical protein